MATKQVWRQRVEAWRASGKRSDDFCEGREFSGGLLRHWAWRLGLTRKRRRPELVEQQRPIRLARVVVPMQLRSKSAAGARDGIEVEIGPARVHVRRGFDAKTLTAVFDVLERRSTRQERSQ